MTGQDEVTTPAASPVARPRWLPGSEWPFTLRFAPVDGHAIHYVDEGSGPTVLMVHAGFWSFIWRDVILRLRDEFRCVALDFPGHGLSKAAPGYDVGLAAHARVLELFVQDVLGSRPATLLLHDLGGPVGLGFAARHPDLATGIVASQTFAWPPDRRAMRLALGLFGSRPMELLDRLTGVIPRLSAGRSAVGRNLTPAGRAAFKGPFRHPHTIRSFHRLLRDAVASEAFLADLERDVLRELGGQEVLTIFGERNDPFGYQRRFGDTFPRSRAFVVPGGGHFPMCDAPDLFAEQVAGWWKDRVRSSS